MTETIEMLRARVSAEYGPEVASALPESGIVATVAMMQRVERIAPAELNEEERLAIGAYHAQLLQFSHNRTMNSLFNSPNPVMAWWRYKRTHPLQ